MVTQPARLLLCDFGCAKVVGADGRRTDLVGTSAYIAPEVVACSRSGYDGRAADIFSCGVLWLTMLNAHFPFRRPPLSALNSEATRATVV